MSTETPAVPSREPGHRISAPLVAALEDRYEIIRETGRGASAIVYLARDLKHERLVALKTLNPDVGPVAGERFLREIQVAAGMQHPHILPMYDSGVADGRLYFVMPFVDGGSLRQRLDAEPQMPIAEALKCAHEIAIALAFAHDQGVVHRDIKPENILFYHGHACLADFGVARVMQEIDIRVTGHGMIVGTPAYMSPEQLTDGGFDGRSDVYSLACVLYEMIAGVHAFSGSTPRELLEKRLLTPPEPIHKHRPDVPQFVEDLLLRALAASPLNRFADARAFADAIEFASRDVSAPKRVSGPRRAIESVPRHPLAWAGTLALIATAGALAATPLRTALRARGLPGSGAARSAYAAGLNALEQWDLPAAERQLTVAAAAEPRFAEAQLRLAQTLQLERRIDSEQFRIVAARLSPLSASLHGRDSVLAQGMMALAAKQYPRACEMFASLRATDSLDAAAWFGSADCLALDSTVVRDPKSRSGWRFRSSWDAAAKAYMRATAIEPAAHRALPYATITDLLVVSANKLRVGHGERETGVTFAGHPELSGDTAVFTPYPVADVVASKPGVLPSSLVELLRQQREVLLAFARQWAAAAPRSPDAFEALASGYEARGEIDEALGALRTARSLSSGPEASLRLSTIEVRLAVKRGDFERAASLADSEITAARSSGLTPGEASRLAGLAMLTGRVSAAARFRAAAQMTANASEGIAPPLTEAESQLFVRAAAGVCDGSVERLRDRLDDLLQSYAQPARRTGVRAQLLSRPMTLAYPCLGAKGVSGLAPVMAIEKAQRAVASGDRRRAMSILDSLDRVRAVMLPGDVALDHSMQEAWLRAAAGDSAEAVRRLDRVLNALPTLGPWAVREEAQSAAIPRALMLRAELAANRGDVAERRRRAQQALVLWRRADPELAPFVSRLRVLSAPAQ